MGKSRGIDWWKQMVASGWATELPDGTCRITNQGRAELLVERAKDVEVFVRSGIPKEKLRRAVLGLRDGAQRLVDAIDAGEI